MYFNFSWAFIIYTWRHHVPYVEDITPRRVALAAVAPAEGIEVDLEGLASVEAVCYAEHFESSRFFGIDNCSF